MAEYVFREAERSSYLTVDTNEIITTLEKKERIVRCNDCGSDTTPDGVKLNHRRYCILQDRIVEPDGFCAWGKRRDD